MYGWERVDVKRLVVVEWEGMPKFRKKPIVIEAVQWFPGAEHPEIKLGHDEYWDGDGAHIMTLEGPLHVSPGDWIIKGVKGEFYPCKPDIFASTYEPVGE